MKPPIEYRTPKTRPGKGKAIIPRPISPPKPQNATRATGKAVDANSPLPAVLATAEEILAHKRRMKARQQARYRARQKAKGIKRKN